MSSQDLLHQLPLAGILQRTVDDLGNYGTGVFQALAQAGDGILGKRLIGAAG
ncbi:hypothetical protein D3C75_1325150 [compost metagenome]